jgi:hypothetical protein
MPILDGFLKAKQEKENSCWACAARMIINYYYGDQKYGSDQALADAWDAAKPGEGHNDINTQQSASGALMDLGYTNNVDSDAIPTKDEISEAISKGQPLLANVGTTPLATGKKRNEAAQQGHWVVIIGISDDKNTIDVFDPDDGKVHPVPYDNRIYKPGQYWQNTSYVDNKK